MADEKDSIKEIEERINKAWSEIVIMEDKLKTLPGQVDNFAKSLEEIQASLNDSKEYIENINSHYEDYFEKTDPSIKTKLETVTEHHATIDKFLKAATGIKDDLDEFKVFIYGDESLKKEGFKKELEGMFSKAKTANENLNKSWVDTYQALYDKIEGLLPGATSTGLSKAYQEQNKNYKWPVIMWSVVFGLTVLGMMIFGVYFYSEVSEKGVSTIQDSLQHDERNVLHQKLIAAMVDMCGYNPSLTLEHKSHDDKPPIPGTDLLRNLRPKKKTNMEAES